MKLVVTGANGQVTLALQEGAAAAGFEVVTLSRPEFDLADAGNAAALLAKYKPDVVISAAAYTAVDLAESNAVEAEAVNATGPGRLAAACAALDLPILHLSTDYVFDGTKTTPYNEQDATGPTGVYGATKLAGEKAVASANPRHVILRTAWVYAHEGKNFVKTMLKLAETRPQLGVVSDQLGCPTYASDIASALFDIARQVKGKAAGETCFGTFNLSGSGDSSWAGFASAIFALAAQHGMPAASVNPIAAADYPTPARRPANSRLNGAKLREVFGVTLPHWHDGLARCIARLAISKP
jgi:dTDP-4-dehydrorhamnose reductase